MLPVEQGTIGCAVAIGYFAKKGYNVSIPLVDNQPYDLVIEKAGIFYTVQCKTTRYKQNKKDYTVQLKKVRANKTETKIMPMDKVDFVFVWCENGDTYCIPFDALTSLSQITLNNRYDEWKL